MPLANEQHPIRHLFSIQGLTDRAQDLEFAERDRRIYGDNTFIHNHRAGEECTEICASLDTIIAEREESRNRVVHHDLTVD